MSPAPGSLFGQPLAAPGTASDAPRAPRLGPCSSPPRAMTLLGCRRGHSLAGQARGCAAGSVLGSGALMGTLCLGLAARYSGDQSEEKQNEIISGE